MADTPDTEKPKLKPANENPWYILMTLGGECSESESFNSEKAIRNRALWNSYVIGTIDSNKITKIKNNEFTKHIFESTVYTIDYVKRQFIEECKNRHVHHIFPNKINSISFKNILFSNLFNLRNMIFPCQLEFIDCRFNSTLTFDASYFHEHIFFLNCDIYFANLNICFFNAYIRFINNRIDALSIINAKINGTAHFTRTIFNVVDLSYSSINGASLFDNIDVIGSFDLSNTTLKGAIDFSGSNFVNNVPNLHEANLHSDTNWLDVRWPRPPFERSRAATHVRYYQRLKQIMEQLKKHEDELNFFAMEMAAQRMVDGSWWTPRGFLNGLYDALSDYGRSVARPLTTLGFVVFACFVALMASNECIGETCTTIGRGKAFALSMTSALGFLPLKKEIFSSLDSLSPAAHVFMATNTVLSFILLFLIGLGLRNRFRMK